MSKRIQVNKLHDRPQSIPDSISEGSVRGLSIVFRGVVRLFIVVALPFSAFVLMAAALFNSVFTGVLEKPYFGRLE